MKSNYERHALGTSSPKTDIPVYGVDDVNRIIAEEQAKNNREGNKPQPPTVAKPVITPTSNPNLSGYIQVGINGIHGDPVVISPFELAGHGGLKYDDAHFKLAESGLYMPTPRIFMTHFVNVVDAFKNKGKLLYANGNEVRKDIVEDIYKHLTINHKAIYGRNAGAWTWLNARFVEGNGWNGLDLETVIEVKAGKLKAVKEKLETCVAENCVSDIKFNNQGLAQTPQGNQEYSQGNNICFLTPIENKVVWFGAGSDKAYLDCCADPSVTYSSLGVFGCAEVEQ